MKRLLLVMMTLALLAASAVCLAQTDCPITMDEAQIFHFCGLDWQADVDTIVEAIQDTLGYKAYLIGETVYDGLRFMAPEGIAQFPGLTDECYLAMVALIPQPDGSWWLECQLTPKNVVFDNATHAANWFVDVNAALQDALGIDWISGLQVLYPDEYTGERTVGNQSTYGELMDAWRQAVEVEGVNVDVLIYFNNMILSLEAMDINGAPHYTSWLQLFASE